jgi:hypothetical protein
VSVSIGEIAFTTIDLEVIKRGGQQGISRKMIEDFGWGARVDVEVEDDPLFGHIVIRAMTRMLALKAREVVPTSSEMVPANWFSHLIGTLVGIDQAGWYRG